MTKFSVSCFLLFILHRGKLGLVHSGIIFVKLPDVYA